MFVLTMLSLAQSAPGYKVVKTWKLGGEGGWDYLTVDPDGRRLFIARSTRVMVVDEDSGKLLTEIPDTPGVHGVALVPEFGHGFISDGGEDMVAIFDLKSLKVLNKVKVGTKPDAIVYDPFTKRTMEDGRMRGADWPCDGSQEPPIVCRVRRQQKNGHRRRRQRESDRDT